MSELNEAWLGAQLQKLMADKLGQHLEWKPPSIQDYVGPYNPNAFTKFNEYRQLVEDACREMLARLSDDEILILVDGKLNDPDEIGKEWHSLQRDAIGRLNRKQPPWFAGGFGHPDHFADFAYWAQIPHFTNHEALLLSLGVEPDRFTQDRIIKMSISLEKGTDLWETLRYMLRRRDQIERQFPTNVHRNRIDPKKLFDWIDLVKLEVHPDFTSRYLVDEPVDELSAESVNSSRPHKREIDSVCQLFAAMAIEYYGYEPGANRSPIPRDNSNAS